MLLFFFLISYKRNNAMLALPTNQEWKKDPIHFGVKDLFQSSPGQASLSFQVRNLFTSYSLQISYLRM